MKDQMFLVSVLMVLVACRPAATPSDDVGCLEGEIDDRGECVPEACGTGDWGMHTEAELFVLAGAEAGGDGSMERPFATIEEGLDATEGRLVPSVAISAGVYEESLKYTDAPDGLQLLGRCAELVTLDAVGARRALDLRGEGLETVLAVSGMTLTGSTGAAVHIEDASCTLDGISIEAVLQTGIEVGADAAVVADQVEIHDVRAAAAGYGIGLAVVEGTWISTDLQISETDAFAVYLQDANVEFEDLAIESVHTTTDDTNAIGIYALASQLEAKGLSVTDAEGVGVYAVGGQLKLADVEVTGTPRPADGGGKGISLVEGAEMIAERVTVRDSAYCGLCVSGASAEVTELLVTDTVSDNAKASWGGVAAVVESSGELVTSHVTLERNDGYALVLDDDSTGVIEGLSLDQADATAAFATGVYVDNSELTLTDSVISGAHPWGLYAVVGATVTLTDGLFTGTRATSDTFATAVAIGDGSTMDGVNLRFSDNEDAALRIDSASATVDGIDIEDTTWSENNISGAGVWVQNGSLQADELQISGTFGAGLVLYEAAEVTLIGAQIEGTVGADDNNGMGIDVHAGSTLSATDVLLSENTGAGLVVTGGSVTATGLTVNSTRPDVPGNNSAGIYVTSDPDTGSRGALFATDCWIDDNQDLGVWGVESDITLEDCEVRGTLPDGDGDFGRGISVNSDSVLMLRRVVVAGSYQVGILVSESEAQLYDLQIEDTSSGSVTAYGSGLAAVESVVQAGDIQISRTEGIGIYAAVSDLFCTNCEIEQSNFAGILALGSTLSVEGESLIRETTHDANLGGGVGFAAMTYGTNNTISLVGVTIEDSELASVYLESPGTTVLSSCSLEGGQTPDVPRHPAGDAIFATLGEGETTWTGGLELENNWIHDSYGVGLLLHGVSATLLGNTWEANRVDVIQDLCSEELPSPEGEEDDANIELCPIYDLPSERLDFYLYDVTYTHEG